METPITSLKNNVIQQTVFKQNTDIANAIYLKLRTREGDVVTLSSKQHLAYSQFGREIHFEDAAVMEEYSISAMASSQYSIQIQGDLNEVELAAIEELIQKVSSITQNFYAQKEINIEHIAEMLAESLGEVDNLELKLEQTLEKSFISQYYTEERELKSSKGNKNNDLSTDKNSNIRNIPALIQSVIESVFRKEEEIKPPEVSRFLPSLSKLNKLLNASLIPLLAFLDDQIPVGS